MSDSCLVVVTCEATEKVSSRRAKIRCETASDSTAQTPPDFAAFASTLITHSAVAIAGQSVVWLALALAIRHSYGLHVAFRSLPMKSSWHCSKQSRTIYRRSLLCPCTKLNTDAQRPACQVSEWNKAAALGGFSPPLVRLERWARRPSGQRAYRRHDMITRALSCLPACWAPASGARPSPPLLTGVYQSSLLDV